jgi:hypothetical protein
MPSALLCRSLVSDCNFQRERCGPDGMPAEAWFAHRRPTDVRPFRGFFRVPLRLDAEHFALVFPAASLQRRLTGFDVQLQQLLQGSSLDLVRISTMLGCVAPGVFTRAFRRWSGTTPAAWRARAQRPDGSGA